MKVVLCHGIFDLMHVGHLEHFERARDFGDYLIVSVLADRYAFKRRPIYKQKARMRLIESLKCVDKVVLCNAPGPQKIIQKYFPHVYVRGSDYKGKRMPESSLLKVLKIPVRYTESIPPRTTDIIKEMSR